MTRLTPIEALRKRQECHDLRSGGHTQSQIQESLNIARATVRDWLGRPRPTEDDIAQARGVYAAPQTDITGQVGFKSRFNPELFAELRAEAELQGAATNRVIGCAVQLYIDVMTRARAGGGEPIDVAGYRP
jgi:hypothetical protein